MRMLGRTTLARVRRLSANSPAEGGLGVVDSLQTMKCAWWKANSSGQSAMLRSAPGSHLRRAGAAGHRVPRVVIQH
jgi:hypothetical protein